MIFKKIMAMLLMATLIFSNVCFATNVVTEFEDMQESKDGISNEIAELEVETPEEDEIFELMEYENGISIIAPATTISQAGGTLQLKAQILEPEEGESVIWSIEQGSNYATISQDGLVTAKTNGTVVCKVHSTADATKIAYKTIIIAIKSDAPNISVSLTGTQCSIVRYVGDVEKMIGSHHIMSYAAGTEFNLKAVPNENYEFFYWKDIDGKIVSYEPELKFTLNAQMSLTAVCVPTSGSTVLIAFRDMSGKILTEGWTTGEIKVPQNPFTLGYSFYCWVNDGKMYNFTPRSVLDTKPYTKNTMFVAGYLKDSTEYNVTVKGANEEGGKYMYNDLVTFTHKAPEEGMRFAYWMRDGKIVSYDEEYKFFVCAFDTEVEAVFVEVDTPVAEVPIVVMSNPQVVDANKISFVCERYLPEHFELLSTGIILSASNSNITLETEGILHSKANSAANNGQYTVRKKDVSKSQTWYARGYMIYKDGETSVTVYSEPVSGKLN